MGMKLSLIQTAAALYVGFCLSFSVYELGNGPSYRSWSIQRTERRLISPVRPSSLGSPILRAALTGVHSPPSANPNLRGVWIDRTTLPETRAECRALIARLSGIGINAIFPEVFARTAAVCYPSERVPADSMFNTGEDILGALCEEAHARGIQVHAWCWCMVAGTAYHPGPKASKHTDWLGVNLDGVRVSNTGTFWWCPSNQQALDYVKSALTELAQRYPLDGINLDYIRVEENDRAPYCMCNKCRDRYHAFLGKRPDVLWPPQPRNRDYLRFRQGMLDSFVADLSSAIKTARPGIALSACVIPIARKARLLDAQNWEGWLTEGYLDFACALTYTNRIQRSKRLYDVIASHRKRGLSILPSIGLHLCRTREELAAGLLTACIDSRLGGFMLFSLKDLPPAVERTLQRRQPLGGPQLALAKKN